MSSTGSFAESVSLSTSSWTPARWYLLVFAIVHLPLGVAGLMVDSSFPIGAQAVRATESRHVFGVLENA